MKIFAKTAITVVESATPMAYKHNLKRIHVAAATSPVLTVILMNEKSN
jgi:hypothetical protein